MPCTTYQQNTSTVTIPPPFNAILTVLGLPAQIPSEWVTLVFQAILTYLLLQEQEEAEEALEAIANCSITAAEELYDAYYDLREYDVDIYDKINTLPSYKARPVKAIQAKREASKFLKTAMGSTNRFECGVRSQILRDTMRATVVSDAMEQEVLEQQEILTEDLHYENCILAKIQIASADMPNIASPLTTSGVIWSNQFNASRSDVAGAVAGLAYTAGGLFAPTQGNSSLVNNGIGSNVLNNNQLNYGFNQPAPSSYGGFFQ